MANEVDTGNPNFFRTFKGKYALTPAEGVSATTDVVMLSCVNDVQVLGDFTLTNYSAGNPIAMLPVECRPATLVVIPVCVNDGAVRIAPLNIGVDGAITLPFDYASGTLYMSGINFNVSDRWYREV